MISAVVITKNEAYNIAACVQALLQVSTDVLVMDTGSTDDTIAVAEAAGAKVIEVPWMGFGKTKNLAPKYAKHQWILSIDADEVLSDDLITELNQLKLDPTKIYAINILTNYCGTWIKHSGWYPSFKKRLFYSLKVQWDEREVHENLRWDDQDTQVVRLKHQIKHYSYRTADDHRRKAVHYARLGAEHLIRANKNVSWFKQYLGPPFRFVRMYLLKLGILDGKAGLLLAYRESKMVALRYKYYRKMKQS